jgi:uncharacterized protein
MKQSGFLMFFIIALLIYASVNFYIFLRGWQVIPKDFILRTIYVVVFLFFGLSFIAGRVFERISICTGSSLFVWIGSFWLAIMAYLFFSILLIDILRASNYIIHFFPDVVTNNHERLKLFCAFFVLVLSIIIVAAGYVNARIPRINKLELTVHKSSTDIKSLHIAMASDIHLGTIISNSRLEELVNAINEIKPDLILLAGDIVDEDIAPVIQNNLGELLIQLKSKYGTYAITGNHEYIGGVKEAVDYLTAHKITMLRDKVVKIGNSFYIAGREDRTKNQFDGTNRKSLQDILSGIDSRLPVILMDHQPFALNEAGDAGVDLQLSGHTHHGQLWPFNFITSKIFELSCGYLRKGGTHFYVSSGYGTWGPPVRTTARPEIAEITLHFGK